MIKKTAVLDAGIEKNFGNINGLINSIIISNTDGASEALVTIKTNTVVFWVGNLQPNTTIRFNMDTVFDESIYAISNTDGTHIIFNIIETL
jgi:hypothetical protein